MKKILNILPFFIGIILILFFWKNTILNISTKIHDWNDGAFMIWTMQNNIKHFQTLDFAHLFETNAMYPFHNSLSFTDHLFIPSIFAFIVSFFSSNPLLQFNLVSIVSHLLVFASFYLLASRFSKQSWVKLLVALYGSFGPYFFSQFGHLQMVFMWPLILSMFYLLHPQRKRKHLILTGSLLGIQFLTGVYLGLIGLMMVGLYFTADFFIRIVKFNKKFQLKSRAQIREVIIQIAQQLCIITGIFIIVSAVSLYGYVKVNIQYHPVREQGEFVTYSAHITDYVLVMFTKSWFSKMIFSPIIGIYNHHDRGELAGFVGVIPLVISGWFILGMVEGRLADRKNNKKLKSDKTVLFWLALLVVIGFVFSLGPRMNWNGKYLVTPLPYWLVMKVFPPIAIMRAVSRWYFMVVFAVTLLFALGLSLLENKTTLLILLALFLFEFYPPPLQVSVRNWKSPSYLYLQKVCKQNSGAILEYPFEYRNKTTNIGKYLSLKTNALMSSTLHDCPTLSGFSSFEPPLFKQWQTDFDTNGITDVNIAILKKNSFAFIRINLDALSAEERKKPESVIHTKQLQEIMRDYNSILYKIIY